MTRAGDAAPHVRPVEHTADAGFEVTAPTLPLLFERAALALVALMADVTDVADAEHADVTVSAPARDELLHGFLSAVLLEVVVRHLLPASVDVTALGDGVVSARLGGIRIDRTPDALYQEVKAVTWHQLAVESRAGGFWARVIVDL